MYQPLPMTQTRPARPTTAPSAPPLHPHCTPTSCPQIVDTVDLFHAKRSRKLSLRFLASYLLRSSIQVRLWGGMLLHVS